VIFRIPADRLPALHSEEPTAEDFVRELESDDTWAAAEKAADTERAELLASNRRDEAPVLADLAAVGIEADWISDLPHGPREYRAAVPVLIDWLPRVSNRDVKEDIVRALTVEWARPSAASALLEEFRRAGDDQLRWAIGNALSVVADDSVFDELVRLATDEQWGKAREMVVLALGNMASPEAVPVLRRLLEDRVVSGHAVAGLGKLAPRDARPDLERMVSDDRAWVRREAEKALRRIDRGQ
jgi:HEAT repeats